MWAAELRKTLVSLKAWLELVSEDFNVFCDDVGRLALLLESYCPN